MAMTLPSRRSDFGPVSSLFSKLRRICRLNRRCPSVHHHQHQLRRVVDFAPFKLNSPATHRLPSLLRPTPLCHLKTPSLSQGCPPFPPPTLRLSLPLAPLSTPVPLPSTQSCQKGGARYLNDRNPGEATQQISRHYNVLLPDTGYSQKYCFYDET